MARHNFSRRQFLGQLGGVIPISMISGSVFLRCAGSRGNRPNILWITCEDMSPHLGCYGDDYAVTPSLDALASEGIRYKNVFATAPVCTPARSSIITGVYASTLGTQNLRGVVPLSSRIRCFTEYLREAGYYCTNNVKEDYNFPTPALAWDESSETAHWRMRGPEQPFFSVFNLMTTHQSQTRYDKDKLAEVDTTLSPHQRHDPSKAPLPPYYPDTPLVRTNMAVLYTQITLMDKQVRGFLDQLEEDGLAEDTIVFFYSDHGDGLPRGKRWLFDSGTRVPMIIRFPEKYRHLSPAKPGTVVERLVSFADFAPTVLNLVGLPIPEYVQGQVFLGSGSEKERETVVAIRDRIDEVLEFSRCVRDKQYLYIRNFFPHRPRMQRSFYSELTPLRREIRHLHSRGELDGNTGWLMAPAKPAEELYDVDVDPYQMNNLADSAEFQSALAKKRQTLRKWMIDTRDLSLLPEPELIKRSKGNMPYDMDDSQYPVERLLETADLVGRGPSKLNQLVAALSDEEIGVRYWAATGLAALGNKAKSAAAPLLKAIEDESASVRFAAAEALCNIGYEKEGVGILAQGLQLQDIRENLLATEFLVAIGDKARPAIPAMKKALKQAEGLEDHGWYMREAITFMLSRWR